MYAPVYRNVDTKNSVAGLGLVEFLIFLGLTYAVLIAAPERLQAPRIRFSFAGFANTLRPS